MHARWMFAVVMVGAALVAAGCGSDNDTSDVRLVVYSGREEALVGPLYEQFERESGIDLDVRYADSAALSAQMLEEGDKSPADVFYAQDAGAIGSVEELLDTLPSSVSKLVDAKYRADNDSWIGVTGRVRTLAYNTVAVPRAELPASVLDVTGARWKDKLGIAPTNASFIGFVTAMRQTLGDDATKRFLTALKNNGVRTYEKNGAIMDAIAKGEIDAGLVNHYYLYELLGEQPDAPVANHFFERGDVGNFVNVSAAGTLKWSKHRDEAVQLVEFLLDEGQTFIVEEAAEREYPLNVGIDLAGNERYRELPPLVSIEGPDVKLSELGDELEASVAMIRAAGLTS